MRALDEQRVHECLGEVAAQLALTDVELLGEQPRGPARGPIPFEPASCAGHVALVEQRERDEEPAQQERAFGSGQGLVAVFAEVPRIDNVSVSAPPSVTSVPSPKV